MNGEAGINVVEKQRLRDAIQEEVRQYLERGGRITVLQSPASATTRGQHHGPWAGPARDGAGMSALLD